MERRTLLLSCWLITLTAMAASAQIRRPEPEIRGGAVIEGRVLSSSGVPLSAFAIVASNEDTGRQQGAISDDEGRFRIEGLAAGRYDVSATREGFPTTTLPDIVLEANQTRAIDLSIPIENPAVSELKFSRASEPSAPRSEAVSDPDAIRRPAPPSPAPEAAAVTSKPEEFIPITNRWRIPRPPWVRYPQGPYDAPYVPGHLGDPYNQNVLKGDYPIIGNRWFLNLSAVTETRTEGRRLPVTGPPSSESPDEPEFFSRGEQFQFSQSVLFTADFFRGVTAFRPVDLRVRVTPSLNANLLAARETGVVNINVEHGSTRLDTHAVGLQEAFMEVRLAEASRAFDFVSVRAGTQPFISDFRGFIFSDNEPGVRVFGNLRSNSHQYNVAYFHMLEKDTNSLLNTFKSRHQEVMIANYYIQDFFKDGYTTQFSFHYNRDKPTFHIDKNGFLARPAPLGVVVPKSINAIYLGWAGDGHLGRLNISHALYQVLGRDRPIKSEINAQMAAIELSIDQDWKRYRVSGFYASGDSDIADNRSRGFDSIFDNVQFAGGSASFWNRQGVRLTGTRLGLTERFSLHPALRTTKEEGQANYVNPGLYLINAGLDADLTTRFRASINANFISFAHTEVLEALLFQDKIRRSVGFDVGMSFRWRPALNDNVIFNAGAAALIPSAGFKSIFNPVTLFSAFVELRMVY